MLAPAFAMPDVCGVFVFHVPEEASTPALLVYSACGSSRSERTASLMVEEPFG